MRASLPRLFVGSSSEGLPVAEALQEALADVADVVLWNQGVFELNYSYLESLLKAIDDSDFAVLALSPDDVAMSRNELSDAPRDNVLFELGLFMGRLGRERSFFVFDKTANLKLPSDLLGISAATYRPNSMGNLRAALGPAATVIKQSVARLGRRPTMLRSFIERAPIDSACPDICGRWLGYSPEGPKPDESNAELVIEQTGSFIRASIVARVREGVRTFEYEGRLMSGQLVLFFEEPAGRNFIVGTVVLHLSGDLKRLLGRSTYYHHTRKEVVANVELFLRDATDTR